MILGLRGLALVGVVIGMPMASYFMVFRPQNSNIAREREDLKFKESVLAKVREANARNDDLERLNNELQENIRTIVARLPSSKEIDDIVRQVSDEAIKAGLQPPAMKSVKSIPAALYMEQPMEMEISGDIEGFRRFLTAIEGLQRITRIPDFKITSLDKDSVDLKAEFTLSIYFQDSNRSEDKP